MHWCAQYIGKNHVPGGRGPEDFDCWGLLHHIYLHRFQIPLPVLPGITVQSALSIGREILRSVKSDWTREDRPFEGCAVAMSQKEAYHHVGIYLVADGPMVLHCWDAARVIVETLPRLRLKGFRKIDFYRHKSWPTS